MTFIPLLVFGALAILLIVLFRRTRTARNRSSTYDGDTWTPMTWTDGNADSPSTAVELRIAAEPTRAAMVAEVVATDPDLIMSFTNASNRLWSPRSDTSLPSLPAHHN
jgi:hypothetical protein